MDVLNRFADLCSTLTRKQQQILPLCAAENAISPFAKIPLDSFIQEKYIMGGVLSQSIDNNFMEARDIFPFYELLNSQCNKLFGSCYADARALSGVNAVTVLLMSLFHSGDTLLYLHEEAGGHGSMPIICRRLGIRPIAIPFDYDNMDIDYNRSNKLIAEQHFDGILLCPSDIIVQPELFRLKLPQNCVLIYDATQTLGLIATQENQNPLRWFSNEDNFILLGATHKTLPGPTCGLSMTKNFDLAKKFDEKINPDYLRNIQLHHILSVILVLAEMEKYGKEYSRSIVQNANHLGRALKNKGVDIMHLPKNPSLFTTTHQLFLPMSPECSKAFLVNCESFGVTLNARYKKLYHGSGIRLGLQEVSRYGWGINEMNLLASILVELSQRNVASILVSHSIKQLVAQKKIQFTFDKQEFDMIFNSLHNCEL